MSTIPATQQFAAIAQLRYDLFRNSLRRKGGAGELAARIVVYPISALFIIGPALGAGFASYGAVSTGHNGLLTLIFWGIFLLQILVSINISAPGLSFDPESLIRFPLSFPRYLIIRLFLGLLSASTVIGSTALLAAALGASLANPYLAPFAFAAALALALTNMLFVRMTFAWVDRWLSTRRAREAFTGIILLGSVGIQYLNVTFNNVGRHADPAAQARKLAAAHKFYLASQPYLMHLPPGLASGALLDRAGQETGLAILQIVGILLFGALFLAVFAWRIEREYRGENLSETNHIAVAKTPLIRTPHPREATPTVPSTSFLSPVIQALLEKEFLYLRRNTAQFYGILLPLAMVFLFAARMGRFSQTGFVFPAAVAYSFLGLSTLSYNTLGIDASGVQTYFLAPVRMRTIIFAKNLFTFAVAALQLILVYLLLTFTSGAPGIYIALTTVAWIIFATLVNTTIGNIRSISAPKKMDPNKVSRKQASGLSALISIAVMLAAAALGGGLILLSQFLAIPWLPIPILLALAAGAYALYIAGLDRLDQAAYNNREVLLEELCKAT